MIEALTGSQRKKIKRKYKQLKKVKSSLLREIEVRWYLNQTSSKELIEGPIKSVTYDINCCKEILKSNESIALDLIMSERFAEFLQKTFDI